MFKKLFGGGGAAGSTADAAAAADADASAPHGRRASSLADVPPTIPEDGEGPVDYAPPPLGVHANLDLDASNGKASQHLDAAEKAGASTTRPSFVWDGATGRSDSWLGGGADLTQADDDAVVMRVPSVALARRMSHRSVALSADFERRRSSANFAKLGSDHDGHSGWVTAACHLITAMIGAGVLGLPNSFAWLGWIGGCVCLVFFLAVTVYCLFHLIECYHVGRIRHHTYAQTVFHLCGKKHAIILALAQRINMALTAVAYLLAGAHSMVFLARASYELQGKEPTPFASSLRTHAIIFGALQIVMSQLPNLESAWWSSAIGAGEF
jgi:hypothetical protein